MIIGITGVFGSGKTTVAKVLSNYGYKHVNADKIGHKLLNRKDVRNAVVKKFGKDILVKGKIDRKKLKDIVFYDYDKLKGLNKIIHPKIVQDIKLILKNSKNIVIDGALLIEVKCLNLFDKLIVVKINKKEQLNRVLKKKKYNKKEINNIIKSQLSQKEKLKYADIVVDNSKGLKNTEKQIKKIVDKLK